MAVGHGVAHLSEERQSLLDGKAARDDKAA
jgi:hypothetical protein